MKPSFKKNSNKVAIKEIVIRVGQILINKEDKQPYRIIRLKQNFEIEVKRLSDNTFFIAELGSL